MQPAVDHHRDVVDRHRRLGNVRRHHDLGLTRRRCSRERGALLRRRQLGVEPHDVQQACRLPAEPLREALHLVKVKG